MEILEAIDRLDDAIHHARPIPLTLQVRIDKSVLFEGVTAIRWHADQLLGPDRTEAVAAIAALEAVAASAKRVLGSDQVRLKRDDVLDELDRLRAVIRTP